MRFLISDTFYSTFFEAYSTFSRIYSTFFKVYSTFEKIALPLMLVGRHLLVYDQLIAFLLSVL